MYVHPVTIQPHNLQAPISARFFIIRCRYVLTAPPEGSFLIKGVNKAPRRQQSYPKCWLGANFSIGWKIQGL
jgi:hypothetical protein